MLNPFIYILGINKSREPSWIWQGRMYFSHGNEKIKVLFIRGINQRHNEMQLNKTQSFSKSINSHIVSMKLFFITHIFIDSSFASILYTFFFLFILPSFSHTLPYFWAQLFILCFPVGTRGKESTCQYRRHKRHSFNPWEGKILWSRKWQHTPVFLPGKFYEQRILMGYRPCCCKDQA